MSELMNSILRYGALNYKFFSFRFNVDLDQFPIIKKIVDALEYEDAFVKAHPQLQPDSQ